MHSCSPHCSHTGRHCAPESLKTVSMLTARAFASSLLIVCHRMAVFNVVFPLPLGLAAQSVSAALQVTVFELTSRIVTLSDCFPLPPLRPADPAAPRECSTAVRAAAL